ncbi:MAG: hypothetical protein COA78_33360 [Blastopirellula sp.]|nr:MAG: hypothetical protein COA78_33360 [Blastopirellula sp.]
MNKESLLALAEALAAHQGVTHWAISSRIFGKGNFFEKLKEGRDCYQSSVERAHKWFGVNWPDDLQWPENIMRPDRQINLERA